MRRAGVLGSRRGSLALVAAGAAVIALGTALPALAGAPIGRYVVDTTTVQDTRTGLVWQRHLDPAAYSWVSALTYCRSLAVAGGGWRLPNVKELQTLVDQGGTAPALDATAFPGTPSVLFWSATPLASDGSRSWGVHFLAGEATHRTASDAARVRCVR